MFLIVYDICDAARLRRAAKLCEDYGVRVQKSVFESHAAGAAFEAFWRRLQSIIDPEADSLVAYPVCDACAEKILVGGVAFRPETADLIVA